MSKITLTIEVSDWGSVEKDEVKWAMLKGLAVEGNWRVRRKAEDYGIAVKVIERVEQEVAR